MEKIYQRVKSKNEYILKLQIFMISWDIYIYVYISIYTCIYTLWFWKINVPKYFLYNYEQFLTKMNHTV